MGTARGLCRTTAACAMLAGLSVGAAAMVAEPVGAAPATQRHVLLLSVDGLHASDVTRYVTTHPGSALAGLQNRGLTYTSASTSEPSDSFPGLLSMMTGASPRTTGVYYDDSYDRTYFAPPAQTATGRQDCTGTAGTETQYAENIDTHAPTAVNANGTRTLFEGIDPAQLPYRLVNGRCVPVQPNQFVRTNTIFSVAHAAHLPTAWSDKHPAYQIVNGFGTPNAIDDLYTPEINADTPISPASITNRPGSTVTIPFPKQRITDKVENTEAYDQIKVNAVLNEIDGFRSDRSTTAATPSIFGMNFQSVSVGEKLVDPDRSCVRSKNAAGCDKGYIPGGYKPGSLDFTDQMSSALGYVDGAVGSMVAQLSARELLGSTEIILTAKHGQAPIDPTILQKVGHATQTVVETNGGDPIAQLTDDDIALIWLKNQSQANDAVARLNADKAGANLAKIDYVLSGQGLTNLYGNPLIDPRTPDLIVKPLPGVIYTSSAAKVAEHGGFSGDDTNVALIVAGPVDGAQAHAVGVGTYAGGVTTYQIAPTILSFLGLDTNKLDGVRLEHTRALPTSGPTPVVPEVPLTVLLPLSAVGVGGLIAISRKRLRRIPTA